MRWVHFLAVFVLVGTSLFWVYAGLADPVADAAMRLPTTRRACVALLRASSVVACVSGGGWLICSLATMTDSLSDAVTLASLQAFLVQTDFGSVWIARIALLMATLAVAFVPMRPRRRVPILGLLGFGLVVDQAWLGHAAEGGASASGVAMIVAYAVHAGAAAAWLGGLPALLVAIAETRGMAIPEAIAAIGVLLSRYALMATTAVILIVASGVANAAFRVGGAWPILLDTAYGAVLSAKLAFVALMLALAAVNRFLLMPRLRAGGATRPLARLHLSVGCELAIGLLVLGAAAKLGITPPPQ